MRGLYIHIPFCIKKCKYCDFTSYTDCNDLFGGYIAEMAHEMEKYRDEAIDTVFIGGGTPTILSPLQLTALLKNIRDIFKISPSAEVTIESNPKTLTEEKLSVLKKGGVNRISIGVQSFNNNELKMIGRVHNENDAEKAIRLSQDCGFSNINLDIMFSLPGQTKESFKYTLEKAVGLNPMHISCYSLILEENTPLYDEVISGKVKLCDEETDRELYEYACKFFSAHGFNQYEISNFARRGYECRHNLKYWNCDEYIGIGVAAHSYFKGERFFNTDSLKDYLSGRYRVGIAEKAEGMDAVSEYIIMGLRKTAGIEKEKFKKRFGKEIGELYKKEIEKFKCAGLMEEDEISLRLTFEGINVSNAVLCEFV